MNFLQNSEEILGGQEWLRQIGGGFWRKNNGAGANDLEMKCAVSIHKAKVSEGAAREPDGSSILL
jgi:hypothetical protein